MHSHAVLRAHVPRHSSIEKTQEPYRATWDFISMQHTYMHTVRVWLAISGNEALLSTPPNPQAGRALPLPPFGGGNL